MNIFYLHPDSISGNTGVFSDEESHHILNVLRTPQESQICVADGKGRFYYGNLNKLSKKVATITIQRSEQEETLIPSINVFVGVLKNRQRMEWMVEKLTETGVNSIIFLNTERTERSKLRIDRFEAIAITAMKQSLRATSPIIECKNLKEVNCTKGETFVAHEIKPDALDEYYSEIGEVNLFIGPEGGFSESEIHYLQSTMNAKRLWLGKLRLRTETAAIHASGIFRFR